MSRAWPSQSNAAYRLAGAFALAWRPRSPGLTRSRVRWVEEIIGVDYEGPLWPSGHASRGRIRRRPKAAGGLEAGRDRPKQHTIRSEQQSHNSRRTCAMTAFDAGSSCGTPVQGGVRVLSNSAAPSMTPPLKPSRWAAVPSIPEPLKPAGIRSGASA